MIAALQVAFGTIARLEPTMLGALRGMVADAAQLATDHTVTELARFGRMFEGHAIEVNLDVARLIATGESFLIPRYAASAARYPVEVQRAIRRELAVGLVRGETVTALADRIARVGAARNASGGGLPGGGPGRDVGLADGLWNRYDYWAERIVRTETIAAYNLSLEGSIRQAAEQVPGLVRRWDASMDGRICSICRELDGTTATLGGDFEGGYDRPPAHPNCRCRCGAWRASWSDLLAEAA